MMARTIILFIHVASAMGIIAGVAIEGVVLAQLARAADDGNARNTLLTFRYAQRVAGPAMALTLLSGFYLAGVYWGWRQGWVDVALASIVLLAAIGGSMTGRTLARLRSSVSVAAIQAARATLRASFFLRTAILAGIVFLMTNKTVLLPSIMVMVIAIVLALVVSLATGRHPNRPSTVHGAAE